MYFSGLCLNSNKQKVPESICRNRGEESCTHFCFLLARTPAGAFAADVATEELGRPAGPPPGVLGGLRLSSVRTRPVPPLCGITGAPGPGAVAAPRPLSLRLGLPRQGPRRVTSPSSLAGSIAMMEATDLWPSREPRRTHGPPTLPAATTGLAVDRDDRAVLCVCPPHLLTCGLSHLCCVVSLAGPVGSWRVGRSEE